MQKALNTKTRLCEMETEFFEMRCGIDLVDAVQTAVSGNGGFPDEKCGNALCAAYWYLESVYNKMAEKMYCKAPAETDGQEAEA